VKCSQPNAAQKRWREAVRELGSVISRCPAVIHHPVGRTAKHGKVEIGHWWVIPLTDEEHKALHNGQLDYYLCETHWEGCGRKDFEKSAFGSVVGMLGGLGQTQVPEQVFNAILDYHK
jgi:hypothetical protein